MGPGGYTGSLFGVKRGGSGIICIIGWWFLVGYYRAPILQTLPVSEEDAASLIPRVRSALQLCQSCW